MAKEVLVREFEENGQIMREWEVTTESGKTHIVIAPKPSDEPLPEQTVPSESNREKLARLETQNLILMDALATVYVETLGDKADEETLADLYTPLVEAGRKTVEQVPEKIKNAVHGRLSAKE
jgi:hypothetical protein